MKRTHHALLVEDSADDAELMLAALSDYCDSDKVVIAKDGEEALDYLYRRGGHAERPHGNPVLILLDIKMPKMDGLEVLRVIKSDPALKTIPVVMLTSSREERDVMSSYRLGTNGYVVKPLLFGELHAVLKKTAAFWLTVNEPSPDGAD
jgi:CheY-like chemotaxis protein